MRSAKKTTTNSIEQIYFDPISKSTNIIKVAKDLNNFVQQNFSTLSNCISTQQLPDIIPPEQPRLSNLFADLAANNPVVGLIEILTRSIQSTTSLQSSHTTTRRTTRRNACDADPPPSQNQTTTLSQNQPLPLRHSDDTIDQSDENIFLQDEEVPDAIKISMYTTLYQQYTQRLQLRQDKLSNLYGLVYSLLSLSFIHNSRQSN
jgi:hypothetical protein